MMAPLDGENGISRKWRWFKKGENEVEVTVKNRGVEHLGEQEEKEELNGNNTFVEELFQDSLEESSSENLLLGATEDEDTVQGKVCSKDTKNLCESLVTDLLFKIMDKKDFLSKVESSQSKSFNPPKNHVKDKLLRQDADETTVGLLMGKVGCQGCGTEQVHACNCLNTKMHLSKFGKYMSQFN